MGIEKFVAVGTICSYPKFTPVPFREEDLWNGYPEEIDAPRKFLYVEDAAEGMLLAAERYKKRESVNLGAGFEISIKELLGIIVRLTRFKGRVVSDRSKPDGQSRRMLGALRAEIEFGFRARTRLEECAMKTIDWYLKHRTQSI